jgi:hypothetical protein
MLVLVIGDRRVSPGSKDYTPNAWSALFRLERRGRLALFFIRGSGYLDPALAEVRVGLVPLSLRIVRCNWSVVCILHLFVLVDTLAWGALFGPVRTSTDNNLVL